ncbi:MAG: Coenzyme F420 hydrogenase/dehydrogenase, beta subunit C-terminal domain [Methanoregulaceae archaeon]|nr:Coenzyme F420 hydrogenase/dehydrogenase, beta subunit C-terminal domain [Methanoregulaceae archaeon]
MERKSYLRLKEEVWDRGICSGCGACVAVCPADAVCFGEAGGAQCPHNIGYCKEESDEVPCGACYEACPRTGEMRAQEMGPFQEILSAKAAFAVPRAQSGGAVTALLVNALEEGLIDAVVTVSEDRWTLRPSSVVISSSDALIHQAGSRYSWWVPLVAALKTAVIEKKFRRIAVIGVPCVVQAVDRIRKSDHELLRPYGKSIRLLIGLFCTESFDYNALVEGKLKKEYKIDTWKVDRLDVKGKLEVRMRDGTSISIPVQELEAAVRPGCHYCLDLTAVFSDLSAGAAGSTAGFTSLIVRTDVGRMFLESAIRNQRIVTGPGPDTTAIEKLITRKLQKNQPETP